MRRFLINGLLLLALSAGFLAWAQEVPYTELSPAMLEELNTKLREALAPLGPQPYKGVVIRGCVVRDGSYDIAVWLLKQSDFEELTGITVDIQLLEFEEKVMQQKVDFMGHTGMYDIVSVDQPQLGEYAEAGWIIPLDSFINDPRFPDPQINDIIPSLLDTCGTWNGKIYAFPGPSYGNLLGYRKDIFIAAGIVDWDGTPIPPVTWTEYLYYGRKIREMFPDMFAAVMQARKGEYLSYDVGTYLWEWGAGYINGCDVYYPEYPKYRVLWDTPQALAALKFYKQLYEELAPPETITYDIAGFVSAMQSGKVAMGVLIQEAVGTPLEDPRYSKVAGQMLYAPVPGKVNPDGSITRVSHIGGENVAINADSRNKEAAYLVARFLVGPELAAAYSYLGGKPFRYSHFTPEAIARYPWLAAQLHNIETGKARPKIPEYPQVSDIFSAAFHAVLSGQAELEPAMRAAAAQANALLAEIYGGK